MNAGNRIADLHLDPAILIAEGEASGLSYFEHWGVIAQSNKNPIAQELGDLTVRLANSRNKWRQIVKGAIPLLLESEAVEKGTVGDAVDDQKAWNSCMKEIRQNSEKR